jgi:hypothetical protein
MSFKLFRRARHPRLLRVPSHLSLSGITPSLALRLSYCESDSLCDELSLRKVQLRPVI